MWTGLFGREIRKCGGCGMRAGVKERVCALGEALARSAFSTHGTAGG